MEARTSWYGSALGSGIPKLPGPYRGRIDDREKYIRDAHQSIPLLPNVGGARLRDYAPEDVSRDRDAALRELGLRGDDELLDRLPR